MNINKVIGRNLKKIRQEKKISLAVLSELSGISKGMLSQIENGETNPTINTIWKVCGGLEIPYTALLEEEEDRQVRVIKKGEADVQNINDKIALHFYYGETEERRFELFILELEPGISHHSVGHYLDNEEYILVLEGELRMTVAGKDYDLEATESISFRAKNEHTYTNIGEGPMKAALYVYHG